MDESPQVARCPVCRAPVAADADRRHRPFCSERCRWADLSRWLNGEYVIPGEPVRDGLAGADDDLIGEE